MLKQPQINKNIEKESKAAASFEKLFDVVKALRSEQGCPWDKEQSPLSIRRDLIEETFEAVDAIGEEKPLHAREELGDVILNAVMISYMFEQSGNFTMSDVLNEVAEKIIRRHPHVFENSSGKVVAEKQVQNADEVLTQWDKIKEQVEGRSQKSILDEVPKGFPPLLKAYKMQKKASKKGFDWTKIDGVAEKINEELSEVRQAHSEVLEAEKSSSGKIEPFTRQSNPELDKAQLHLEEEIGDLLFAVVNYSRHLGVDPTVALSRTNQKFYKCFCFVEEQMKNANLEMNAEHLKEMDDFWEMAKTPAPDGRGGEAVRKR